ncbi:MAG TPA: glutaminase A [Gammaproteobacteria bacterium]|nr:glutaminase A [Gammaproteobacteria bacterium]
MNNRIDIEQISQILTKAVEHARHNKDGFVANYIPELRNVDPEILSASIALIDGTVLMQGDHLDFRFTLQSVSKLVLLIGMMEEFGAERVFSWINAEPSGLPFAAIGDLDRFGPVPSNPLINAGAICLSGRIPGTTDEQLHWVKKWINKLFAADLEFSDDVYHSEFGSADRNRSLAYLMKSTGVLKGEVEEVLKPYFSLCSYTVNIAQAAYLPMLLANGGVAPDGTRVISELTSNQVVSIMATCGLYNESGMHLVLTGVPAKNAISGLIIAVGSGRGGIAAFSPRLNPKGTSIRGHMIISEIARELDWHFAAPRA